MAANDWPFTQKENRPMNRNMKDRIEQAYYRLARAVEHDTEGDKLLRQAFQSALESERQHRRGFGRGKYRASVETAARYFVVKWFADPRGKVTSARDAAAMRADCLYAMALRELVDSWGKAVDTADVEQIDYSTQIASEAA